jgi:hypothetical protein
LKGQLFGIVLFIIIFLATDKPSKEWIIVPSINKVMFAMYVVMHNLSLLFVFKKYSWITLMIYVLQSTYSTPYPSNAKSCKSFSLYFSIMKTFKDMGE